MLALLLITNTAFAKYGNVKVEVVKVYDGDTITVNIPDWPRVVGEKIGVRIISIDTPEIKDKDPEVRKAAIAARELAKKTILEAREVSLVDIKRDKYFRLLGDLEVDGKLFSEIMLDSGLAVRYNGGKKTPWNEILRSRNSMAE